MTQEHQDAREDAQTDAEVEEIAELLHPDPDCSPLRRAVEGDTDVSLGDLGYEEWLTPVRLSANRVVVECVTCGVPTMWYEIHHDLLHVRYTPGGDAKQVMPGHFMSDMTRMEVSERFELRPRLRENTKLGGEGQ